MPSLVPGETEHGKRDPETQDCHPSADFELTITPKKQDTNKRAGSLTWLLLRDIERAKRVTFDSEDDFSDTENANYARKVVQERIASGEIHDRSLQLTEEEEIPTTDRNVEPEPEKQKKKVNQSEEIEAQAEVEPEPEKGKNKAIDPESEKTPDRQDGKDPQTPTIDLTTPLVDMKDKAKTRSPGLQPPTKRLRMTSATVDNADFTQEIPENNLEAKFVSDDYTGTGKIWIVEVPQDFCQRFQGLFETFTVGSAEIQVHLCGTR